MSEALGQSLPFAVGAAISPVPIVATVLLLTAPGSRANVVAFVTGWLAGLAGVGLVVLTLAGEATTSGDEGPGTAVALAMLAGAAALLWLATRSWSKRPREGRPVETPGWMERIEGFGARESAVLGLGASCNPKNLLLTVGGALEIASVGSGAPTEVAALAVFVAVSSVGVAAPVVLRAVRGQRSAANLAALGDWLARNSATIMATVLVLLAASLAGDAVPALLD